MPGHDFRVGERLLFLPFLRVEDFAENPIESPEYVIVLGMDWLLVTVRYCKRHYLARDLNIISVPYHLLFPIP